MSCGERSPYRRDSRERPARTRPECASPAAHKTIAGLGTPHARRDSRRDGNTFPVAQSVEQRSLKAKGQNAGTKRRPYSSSLYLGAFFKMIDDADYSAACDDLADLGLTEDQIDDVWRWHRVTARRQAQTAGGVAVVRLLTYMLTGHKDSNLHLRLVGLAFGVGMGHITGHEHQAAAAHALGVSRQAVADAGERARKAILG